MGNPDIPEFETVPPKDEKYLPEPRLHTANFIGHGKITRLNDRLKAAVEENNPPPENKKTKS
ncbi:MAG: hypothetical protein UT55_C0005G0020 [Candidatus Peregrinibacteria bacterium GW2011_GWE2_39_6]|nr:MAG: hypothetical protein UT36_C0011G0012 [Candidatus Peregrinibacteria bacterium GW2011_GWF2_39_17]KKR26607.1 MAG: hypothetical protein UT55_C0005G0020 [Candidatus Peregrinibacteria bacterium GW2011_GWE2_39_6]HCW32490.1 hypothetical protein [Candidatus Peregrinibacteria bacterium]